MIAAAVIATSRPRSASEIASAGISTTTSPKRPDHGAATPGGERDRMPEAFARRPLDQLDPDHQAALADLGDGRQAGHPLAQDGAEQLDLRESAAIVRSRSNVSSVAIAAAQASGLPVYVWPWKNVRPSDGAPRKPS